METLNNAPHPIAKETIATQDWGSIDYASALQRQIDLVDLVGHELARETLIFCSHPLGEVDQEGRAVSVGPHQINCYPILDLTQRGRDLEKYTRDLEQVVVSTLKDFGITATARSGEVWVGSKMICAIAIGLRKWISYNGISLNVELSAGSAAATSIEEILGSKVERELVIERLRENLIQALKI